MSQSAQIKEILSKIKLKKIIKYLTANPQSKTLKQIIRCSQKAWESEDQAETFRLAVKVAYALDTLVNKTGYVREEKEKKYWLEISGELFGATVGIKT